MFGTCHHLIAHYLDEWLTAAFSHYFKGSVTILAESRYCGLTFSNKMLLCNNRWTVLLAGPFVSVGVNPKYVEALYSRHNFLLNFMCKCWSLTYYCKLFHCAFSIMYPKEDSDLYKSIDRQLLISKILVYCP